VKADERLLQADQKKCRFQESGKKTPEAKWIMKKILLMIILVVVGHAEMTKPEPLSNDWGAISSLLRKVG